MACVLNNKFSYLYIVCMCVLSRVQFSVTSWTEICQAPLSMGFSRQEYWSGLPFPPSGILDEGSNTHLLHLLHCRWILDHWSIREAPTLWRDIFNYIWTFLCIYVTNTSILLLQNLIFKRWATFQNHQLNLLVTHLSLQDSLYNVLFLPHLLHPKF